MTENARPDLFVFRLGAWRFALPLERVNAAVRAAHAAQLPGAPELVLGMLNVRGEVLPVVDLGRRFGLPPRPVAPEDFFVIARSARRTLALRVDAVDGPARPGCEDASAPGHLPAVDGILGVAVLEDGLTVIFDLDACLSLDEEERLGEALARAGAQDG
ncbi:MAG: chemotaxis protein CheW [Desulfovibrionaceae bacterium]|nr:chemotaxis protein CheW [Desulfovibrionaceae bacterium]MBF0515031.1 chemotaxis protein CheW [Desulfovibrionaceae bacterium]